MRIPRLDEIDPRTKLVFVLSVSLFSISLDKALSLTTLAAASCIFFMAARPSAKTVKGVFFFLVLITWGIVFSQGMFYARYPRTVLLTIIPPFKLLGREFSGLYVYLQGLEYGLIQSMRFVSCSLAGLGLCLSTGPDRMFKALNSLGVPRAISFISTVAVRFIPEVTREMKAVRDALRIKGYKPLKKGILYTAKIELRSLFPVFAGAVMRAENISRTLAVRGFDPTVEVKVEMEPWRTSEKRLSLAVLLLSLATCAIKLIFFLYESGIFYSSSLRPLYFVARELL